MPVLGASAAVPRVAPDSSQIAAIAPRMPSRTETTRGASSRSPPVVCAPHRQPESAVSRRAPSGHAYWHFGMPSAAPPVTAEPTAMVQRLVVDACAAVADHPVAVPVNVSVTPAEPVGAV